MNETSEKLLGSSFIEDEPRQGLCGGSSAVKLLTLRVKGSLLWPLLVVSVFV